MTGRPAAGAADVVEVRDPRMGKIVGNGASLDTVAGGFVFIEGALWHPQDRFLLFSDILGDRIYRWSSPDGLSTFRQPSGMANGNSYDRQGRLVTCEHANSRVTRTEPDGEIVTLADHYDGRELNSPNDVVVKSDDSIYFTDPNFGRTQEFGVLRDPELSFQGVYRLDPSGDLTLLVDDFEQPNGLCFSPDEETLFVNDTQLGHIRAFPMRPDGSVGSGTVWARLEGAGEGVADGMKVDSQGNLYCAGPGGVHVFDASARSLGVIRVPEVTANFTWGGDDLRTLFLCASTTLRSIRVGIAGIPVFSRRALSQPTAAESHTVRS